RRPGSVGRRSAAGRGAVGFAGVVVATRVAELGHGELAVAVGVELLERPFGDAPLQADGVEPRDDLSLVDLAVAVAVEDVDDGLDRWAHHAGEPGVALADDLLVGDPEERVLADPGGARRRGEPVEHVQVRLLEFDSPRGALGSETADDAIRLRFEVGTLDYSVSVQGPEAKSLFQAGGLFHICGHFRPFS